MEDSFPNSKSAPPPDDRSKIRSVISHRGLTGLANDTKWDELIDFMRQINGWKPSFRFKCVDGRVSDWDNEWYYHLPFPMISVEWFDMTIIQSTRTHPLKDPVVTDHSHWIQSALNGIGLDFRCGERMIRVFGYAPRSLEAFDS